MFLDLHPAVASLPLAGHDRDLTLTAVTLRLDLDGALLDVATTAVVAGAAAAPHSLDIATTAIATTGDLATTIVPTEEPDIVWLEI